MAKSPAEPATEAAPAKPRGRGLVVRLVILGVVGAILGGGVWWALTPPEQTPPEKLKLALKLLDEKQLDRARTLAEQLHAEEYRDPDFSGGAVYVLGMTTFLQAATGDSQSREQQYVVAAGFLKEADHLTLAIDRRPAWAAALGEALHASGSLEESIPLLEEAVRTNAQAKLTAGMMLLDAYLEIRAPEHLDQALALSDTLLKDDQLTPAQRGRARLFRAQAFLAKGEKSSAEAVLNLVTGAEIEGKAANVLRAQTLLDDHKPIEALTLLTPLAADERLDRQVTAQAQYLLGVASLAAGRQEDAVAAFEKVADRFEGTHEAFAGRVLAAETLRRLGRKEESLEAYSASLRSIHRPSRYRNRWLPLGRLQTLVRDAWKAWLDERKYAEAIALAELMPPTVPHDEAHELVARAARQWAESTRDELERLTYPERQSRREELAARFHEAGKAYARLAESRKTSQLYSDALWIGAESYFAAREYELAIEQLDRLLVAGAGANTAQVRTRRAQCLLNLGRLDEALVAFEEVLALHPTDPASFTAQYLIGDALFEKNDMPGAELAWRRLIDSKDLRPEALEWRQAEASLAHLLLETSEADSRQLDRSPPEPAVFMDKLAAIDRRLAEAGLRFDEYLERYPAAPDRTSVRFQLARVCRARTRYLFERLNRAETDTARAEFRHQLSDLYTRAEREFNICRQELIVRREQNQADEEDEQMLRQSQFELAGCLYGLEKYEQAIDAYGRCAAEYQRNPETLGAYVQIANCYTRLKRPSEALSTLVQARLLLKQLPDAMFVDKPGRMTRVEWENWLSWAAGRFE
jgi:tetratricopeptide (TPR) repeat protein